MGSGCPECGADEDVFSDPSLYFHLLGLLVLSIWVGIAVARDRFWLLERDPTPPSSTDWPPVTAVIPARNEAESLPEALHSLWSQQYPGGLRVIVVDDQSEDGTAEAAREAAGAFPDAPLTVLRGAPVPPGWAGKVWAMHQGLTRGLAADDPARYVLFCDADVRHGPDSLRELVARAEAGGLDLASLMVRLRCRTWPERALIPAFVWFFRMLYPFRRVNSPRDPLAGAAGGAMLLRREALARTSSLERIRD
ncbi:MAG: glycosyltransferase, partial [Armatimonadetes bacterium]|nr:glycosyltransferase [Armatimonadota bacterium]